MLAILLAVRENEGAKILGIFTVPSKSHSILGYELFKELVKAGHQVRRMFLSVSSNESFRLIPGDCNHTGGK